MWKKTLLSIVVFASIFSSIICPNIDAGGSDLKGLEIYDSDEVATHYYDPEVKIFLAKGVIYTWAKIVPKRGGLALLKQVYVGPGSCDDLDLSNVEELRAPIEINCLEKRYRVIGVAFYRREVIIRCEPPEQDVKWMDIPPQSAIEKLSKIICQGKKDRP